MKKVNKHLKCLRTKPSVSFGKTCFAINKNEYATFREISRLVICPPNTPAIQPFHSRSTIKENTHEIGLRMSIGARGVDILTQFLIEAIIISITGGIIGILFGAGASLAVKFLLNWPVSIQLYSVVLSFVVCTVTGVFFGWYPAKKAAALDPIEALRYE